MDFSSTAIQWREKETKKLCSFIAYSLLGSVVLHLGVLAFGVANFLKMKMPEVDKEPIEVTIVEPPPEVVKSPESKQQPSQLEGKAGGGSAGGGGGKNKFESKLPSIAFSGNGSPSVIPSVKNSVVPIQQPIQKQSNFKSFPLEPIKISQSVPNIINKPQPSTISPKPPEITEKPEQPSTISPKPPSQPSVTPTIAPTPIPTQQANADITPNNSTSSPTPPNHDSLKKLLADARNKITNQSNPTQSNNSNPNSNINTSNPSDGGENSNTQASANPNNPIIGNDFDNGNGRGNGFGNGNGRGNGVGNGNGDGIGNGSGNGLGNGNGDGTANGSGNGNNNRTKPPEEKKVATAPTSPENSSSKLNPADCEKCDVKYPENARKRKIEGRPEVILDYDETGEVRNLRLSRSSGNPELDEALLEQARKFKLKPTPGGKQGVRVSANFAIQGSQRHRERKRRREKKQRETTAATSSPTEATSRKIHSEGIITDVPKQTNNQSIRQNNPQSSTKPDAINQSETASSNRRQINNDSSQENNKPRRSENNNSKKPRQIHRLRQNSQQSQPSQKQNSSRESRLRKLQDILRPSKQELEPPQQPQTPVESQSSSDNE